jgi:predicted small secreted protein
MMRTRQLFAALAVGTVLFGTAACSENTKNDVKSDVKSDASVVSSAVDSANSSGVN